MELIALILLIGALSVGFFVFGMTVKILYSLAAGLLVGGLARLVLPGTENIGLLGTALVGIVGGLVGGLIGSMLGLGSLLELGLSVASAAGLLTVLGFRQKARA